MRDYRGVIQNIIETVEQISVRGAQDGLRVHTAVYALRAMQKEMTAELEAVKLRAGEEPKNEKKEE